MCSLKKLIKSKLLVKPFSLIMSTELIQPIGAILVRICFLLESEQNIINRKMQRLKQRAQTSWVNAQFATVSTNERAGLEQPFVLQTTKLVRWSSTKYNIKSAGTWSLMLPLLAEKPLFYLQQTITEEMM